MPRSDTRHLTQTTMGLARQSAHSPPGHSALGTVTTGGTENVDHLVLLEHRVERHSLLKQIGDEIHLVRHRSAVDLDLLDVRFLLSQLNLGNLGVTDGTNHLAIVLGPFYLFLHLVRFTGILLGVLGERLLFALVPALVESSTALITQMPSPHPH